MDLPTVLEIIEHNLGVNIDSFYNQTKALIGKGSNYTDKIKTFTFLKGELKKQVGEYLKIVVKNIRHKILYQEFDDYISEINEAVK